MGETSAVRVGVDFRFLALGRQAQVRGIPRFTQEQLQSVLTLDAENTYLLLCDAGVDLDSVRAEILHAPNAHVVCAPEGLGQSVYLSDDQPGVLARFSAYQRWLESLHLDLYHATCPFWLGTVTMPGIYDSPYVATAYDLIPLLYPAQYLPDPELVDAYHRRLLFLQQATRIAAISAATAKDLVEHLGVPAERIDITAPAPSSCFRPLPSEVTCSILASLEHRSRRTPRHRVSIPSRYVLCITDLHYSKNLTTLLAAYAELSTDTRTTFPLVVAGHLGSREEGVVQRLARRLGIEPQLVVTGRVSDEELNALYNAATVMVHPSHHEGFGLPVAEAMRCGAPVITTTRSALPEVAGDAAVLVDSDDQSSLTRAIDLVLHDSDLREDLRRRSFGQAGRFNAPALGRATLGCYAKAASTPANATESIRVAFWSPIPPQDSDVSEYAQDLITALAADPGLELDVFVGGDVLPPVELMRAARVHHASDFERCARHTAFDVSVYQFSASAFHPLMQQPMLNHPGVVVLHDLRWSHALLGEGQRSSNGEQDFLTELVAAEGEGAGREWKRLRTLPVRDRDGAQRAFLDEHLMLGHLVDSSACCVTDSAETGRELVRRYPHARFGGALPVGAVDSRSDGQGFDRTAARAYLHLERQAFLVVVLAGIDHAVHFDTALEAFARLRHAGVDAQLAVVGAIPRHQDEATLRARAATLGVSSAVRMAGQVPRVAMEAYVAASDVVIVLQDRESRQMPAAAVRTLAAGRCMILSDTPGVASIPDTACVRVAPPPRDKVELIETLRDLAVDRRRREDLERAARAHYDAAGRLQPTVDGYARLIREHARRSGPPRADARVASRGTALWGRPPARDGSLRYSKACELEDFAHPQLRDVIRDVCSHKRAAFGSEFPRGYEYRKDWEVAMAVRTLADHGALRPDARVLGVAAGTEDTVFYLTRHVREVAAIDRYLEPGKWTETAPSTMLVEPGRLAPFRFRPEHLTVRHMDARILGYPDESFDGIFSSGSIEHFGDLESIAAAAYEMGRVLKPGGILTLSTELLLFPDASGAGAHFPGTFLLSPAELQRYIVEASGLEPIDDLDVSVSHWTLGTSRDITMSVMAQRARLAAQPEGGRGPDWTGWEMPHIVLEMDGKRFTSVHLALRRAPVHPVVDNSWARPSPALRAAVARDTEVGMREATSREGHGGTGAAPLPDPLDDVRRIEGERAAAGERLGALQLEVEAAAAAVAAGLQEAALPRAGVYLTAKQERMRAVGPTGRHPRGGNPAPPPSLDTVACQVVPTLTPPYTVVVERDGGDIISAEYLAGRGASINATLISLVLSLVPPGGFFLDVGANIGSMSLPLAAAGRRVLGVEAASVNVSLLEAGVRLSGVADRMRVVASAVGDRIGDVSFVPHGPHGQVVERGFSGSTRVPITTVDALLDSERVERVDLVKIDVEGAELDVLRGMSRLAQQAAAPHLLVECCPHTLAAFGHTTADLVSLLEAYGYAVYSVGDHRLVRRRPEEVQVTTVMDVLAVKHGVRRLHGWRVEPPMTQRELVQRLLEEARQQNPDCRASVARVAQELHRDVLTLPHVSAALTRLRHDPEPTVRAAASWWDAPRARAAAPA